MFDPAGVSRFQLLQRREGGGRPPVLVVFDCLYARGRDLRAEPLHRRRQSLEAEVKPADAVRLARRLAGDGFAAFAEAQRSGLEGIIAKDGASRYLGGVRSPAWRKVKVRAEDEFVIGGDTAPGGSRMHLGALLIGAYEEPRLRYAGKVGTGFTADTLSSLMRRFPDAPVMPASTGDSSTNGSHAAAASGARVVERFATTARLLPERMRVGGRARWAYSRTPRGCLRR